LGYPSLSGKSWREIDWRMILNPPILASCTGLLLATVPPLNALIVQPGAPLRILIDTGQLISQGVFPCALLILGANLAEKLPPGQTVPWNAYLALCLGKLVILPTIGYGLATLAWKQGWIPDDPMFRLVLMVEAAVPPANNLMIMCQMHKNGEAAIARLLLCAYCVAIPTLTFAIMIFIKAVTP
jgi:predicted permease